jgi:hypothetical protein
MINSLITSQTRIRLLKKFFLNSSTRAHLRGLEAEFGESTNGIRIELNRMETAELLKSSREGNKKVFFANRNHPLFNEIHNIIIKDTGIDRVIEKVVHRIGNLRSVYLIGDLARGIDANIIELILIGTDIDCDYLKTKVKQAEKLAGRRVECTILEPAEAKEAISQIAASDILLLWGNGTSLTINGGPDNE